MSYKDKYADEIERQFCELETRLIDDIVRRIKKTGEITSTADWQITRLNELGYSSDEIETLIKERLEATYPEMFELYDKVVEQEYTRNKTIYEQINGEFVPYEENDELQHWISAAKEQTKLTMENFTNTLGVVEQINGQMTYLPLTEYYKKTLDAAILDITSGAFDYNSVLKRTVKTLSNSGIRAIDYESGYSSRLPVAVRRAVMTGTSQMAGKINEYNAEKLGTEYFEVEWHASARPSHRVWQGKVWTKDELVTVCGLGTATGLLGVNCYHEYYPFFPGISERNWTDEELTEMNAQEDVKRDWKGKEYDSYDASQKQRQMETSMRAQRMKVRELERGGADHDDIIIEKARYQGQLREYKEFSKVMNLEPQMERVYIDGLGRVGTNSKAENARYTEKMLRNAKIDSKQYQKYKKILGEDAGSLEDFRQMKYNEPEYFELLKQYAMSVSKGMVSPLSGFDNYLALHTAIETEIVGITTARGIRINRQSKHFIERVVGTKEDPKDKRPRSGVEMADIKEALINPLDIRIKKDHKSRISEKYIGKKATVTVNPETGELIQCNPTDSDLVRRLSKNEDI